MIKILYLYTWAKTASILGIMLLTLNPTLVYAETTLQEAENLQHTGALAVQQGNIIMLLVSQTDCSFCKRIKSDIIQPMLLSGDYQSQVLIRELMMDTDRPVIDFTGKSQSSHHLAKLWGISLTPTLIFLDGNGHELRKRMIGYYTPDMFYYYVEEAIREAIDRLKAQTG